MSSQGHHQQRYHYCKCAGFSSPSSALHYPPNMLLSPLHRDLDLRVDIEGEVLEGTVTTTFRSKNDRAQEITLHAVDILFEEVSDPDGAPLSWRYDGRELHLRWENALPKGTEVRVEMKYRVEHPASGLYFSSPSEGYAGAPTFAGTDHETERARHWLPCVDLPSARTTLNIRLRVREDLMALTNGILLSETPHEDGTKTFHWSLEQPCPSYLTCFAVGPFVCADDGEFEGIKLAYFALEPFTQADLLRTFGETKKMLSWLTKKLDAPFPYPKYYQFALPGIGGAMENISLVSWDDIFVLNADLAREWQPLIDRINVHEMAHSYFGDLIVCRDFAHAWLKESWATYIEVCWFEDQLGEAEQHYQLVQCADAYFREADGSYQRPIVTRAFESSWQMYDAHLYPGGGLRLHTLRCELGDEVFWDATREYIRQYSGKVVETDEFRRVYEAQSGRSLVQFFDQWFYRAGYPTLKVKSNYDLKSGRLTFNIQQPDLSPKKSPEVPYVPFNLELELTWVSGGTSNTQVVRLSQTQHEFVFVVEKEPSQVLVDPRGRTLHKLDFNPGPAQLLTQLREGATVISRIHAVRTLAKSGTFKDIQNIRDAFKDESFWGVRAEMARSLGKTCTLNTAHTIRALIKMEEEPRVLQVLFLAAADFREADLSEAIEEKLQGGLPPHASAAAYQALGARREEAPLQLLKEAASSDRPLGFAQMGAARGLADSRLDAAAEHLLTLTAPGDAPDRVRVAVADALGQFASKLGRGHLRERLVEALIQRLRDPVFKVRMTAVKALGVARDPASIGPIRALRGRLSAQEKLDVDGVLKKIEAGYQQDLGGVEGSLEKVKADNMKLEERLRKMEEQLQRLISNKAK